MSTKRTNVYIDGFNLYYGSMKDTPYKWLDLKKFCDMILPKDCIVQNIYYFTAQVKGVPWDPDQPIRQQLYFRALQTIPNLKIIKGHFLVNKIHMPKAPKKGKKRSLCEVFKDLKIFLVNKVKSVFTGKEPTFKQEFVRIIKTEEKGSDVNLATHLLIDANENKFDAAAIISNDTDFALPLEFVKNKYNKDILLLTPRGHTATKLSQHSIWVRHIKPHHLKRAQFPTRMVDSTGEFHKPNSW